MTVLDYTIDRGGKKPQEKVRTKTALSMQATIEGALGARQPQPAGGSVAPQAKADGFGRSV